MTIVFCSFVFLQFFNAINCRVVGKTEYNIFKKPLNSLPFLFVLVVIFAVQYCACGIGIFQFILNTTDLSGDQLGQAILTGSTVLAAAFLLKLTPRSWVDNIREFDEKEAMGGGGALMNILEKAKSPKVSAPALNQTVDESVDGVEKEKPVESEEKNSKVGSKKVEEENKQESGSDQASEEDGVLQTEVDVNEKPFMGNINGS